MMSELLAMDEPRKRYGAMMSGLDISYDLGEGHPLLGRRMPDLALTVDGRPMRLFTLLHDARGVLVNSAAVMASISRLAPIASHASMPIPTTHGSFRRLGRSPSLRPCWCGPTGMWGGWGMRARAVSRKR